ncbi:MAG TPA: 50S ribosomal protein L29 [Candidatus Hydrogenedentes bacterium]|nr:50S ribosomal protein L29 [Candidatus Hydrogenedentota bacterium]HOT50655.1 50S ribosomal protein L29 [Candidatus Hydrogenedentota bacterium]HOV74519.1 50S ribosomal protein L29 [Candidatus Hydrogenedentota bacterium]HPC18043.1 50S ribosomal protein L29 [Candidatus Hydrogenedentota bacterium]HRT21933.1 50S ribosomal protein L29 [Candidatus Hydrogenedentota bacterium]
MKARDIRELTQDELENRLRERRAALMNFKMQQATGVVDNVRGSRNARRDIARILTILRERELAASKGSH